MYRNSSQILKVNVNIRVLLSILCWSKVMPLSGWPLSNKFDIFTKCSTQYIGSLNFEYGFPKYMESSENVKWRETLNYVDHLSVLDFQLFSAFCLAL